MNLVSLKYYLYSFLVCISLCACATNPTVSSTDLKNQLESKPAATIYSFLSNEESFGSRNLHDIPSQKSIFELSDIAKDSFQEYVLSTQNNKKTDHEKVYGFLQDFGWNFTYSDVTYNSVATYENQSGNCMSLALLTTAIAKYANVPIKYQMVRRLPVYKEFGSITFSAQHVRSVIFEPPAKDEASGFINVISANAIIDYYPSRYNYIDGYVDENEFIAMYYRNLAAEELGKENYAYSFWLAKESLKFDEESIEAINILAVVHRRVGDFFAAEKLYEFGLKKDSKSTSLLRNYHVLLLDIGKVEYAKKIKRSLHLIGDENPFALLKKAEILLDQNKYELARKQFMKVIDKAPYLHQSYFGLARTEYLQGNINASKKLLEFAQSQAYEGDDQDLYRAKLNQLKQESSSL